MVGPDGIGFGESGQSPFFPYEFKKAFPKIGFLGKPFMFCNLVAFFSSQKTGLFGVPLRSIPCN
jgi:hypothetical protein